jgi:hypothetical protein
LSDSFQFEFAVFSIPAATAVKFEILTNHDEHLANKESGWIRRLCGEPYPFFAPGGGRWHSAVPSGLGVRFNAILESLGYARLSLRDKIHTTLLSSRDVFR